MGLGNPGARYRNTRHNAGFRVVDILAGQLKIPLRKPLLRPYRVGKARVGGREIILAQPLTYMNRSGEAVGRLLSRYNASPEDLLVVCDTLDLPVGRCRLRLKGSSGGHLGLESTIRRLGTGDFKRLVIGIGRPRSQEEVVGYVLGEPGEEEAGRLEEAFHQAADGIRRLLEEEPVRVMNALNARG